jgi:hypothetical protein
MLTDPGDKTDQQRAESTKCRLRDQPAKTDTSSANEPGTCGIGGDLLVGAAARLWRPSRGIDSSLTSSGKPPTLRCDQAGRDHAKPPPNGESRGDATARTTRLVWQETGYKLAGNGLRLRSDLKKAKLSWALL